MLIFTLACVFIVSLAEKNTKGLVKVKHGETAEEAKQPSLDL